MNFLAPLFVLGGLAIAGPILFHLIQKDTRKITQFSSLLFLQPTPPRFNQRRRLDNLWLLLLRCLILLLLSLGFARPFFAQKTPPATAFGALQRTLILLDTSASMRRESLWLEACAKAELIVSKTPASDEVAILSFDQSVQSLLSFSQWRELAPAQRSPTVHQLLSTQTPGWRRSLLDSALTQAADSLELASRDSPAQLRLVVISDLQEGSRIDSIQGYQWPKNLQVVLEPISAKSSQNAGLHWLPEDGLAQDLSVRVTNTPGSKLEQFTLRWPDSKELPAYVPAGQSRVFHLPFPSPTSTTLLLSGDETAFDNTLYKLPNQPLKLSILFIGADRPEDSRGLLYYLRRAFPKTQLQIVEILAHSGQLPIPAADLDSAQLLVLGDGANSAAIDSARNFARRGKIVLAPINSPQNSLAQLLEVPTLAIEETSLKDYALLAQIDFQHPLFAPFADPRFSDFTKIHFWKTRHIPTAPLPNARILASFDDQSPALLQIPIGQGSLILLASSWRPQDSQLALSSKFVPFLHALLELSSQLPPAKALAFIGDEVPIPNSKSPTLVRKPDGQEISVAAGAKFTETDQPGIYSIGAQRFAINLAPEESRTAPMARERLTSLGLPLLAPVGPILPADRLKQAQSADLEAQQKLWRWLILAALLVVLGETLLGGKLARLSKPAP